MEWNQVYAIIGVNVALFAIITTIIVWMVNKMDADVKSVCARLDSQAQRLDGHAQRIDQLYKMFVDLLKERK